MEGKKKDYLLIIVIVLNLVITILSLVLGCLMYTSNSKSIMQNLIYVEMTDLLSNIRYGLHFGKSLDSYYGMDEELSETIDKTENVDRIYIVSDEKGLLFTTDESTPGYDVITLAEGGNTVKRGELVCAFELTNNSRLITSGDISYKRPIWIAYYKYLAFVSFAGFLVSSGVMILVWRHMKNRKWAYRILTSILLAWIIIISGYVGYSAYKEYNSSIIGMENKIEKAIKSDVDTLHRMGIRDENISGMDEYLLRYSNNIPEIEAITYNGTGYDFTISSSYMNRVAVDYLLQTLLFFAFSSMILTEHNLFMSGIGMNNWEEDENG